LKGHCRCRNIALDWQTVDHSLVPRRCGCSFCRARGLCWVSKRGTRLRVIINNPRYHELLRQGTETAEFHRCTHCDQVVLATSEIDGDIYAVISAVALDNPAGFAEAVCADFDGEAVGDRLNRRRLNWCGPVQITYADVP
jgi:hypothetical protein